MSRKQQFTFVDVSAQKHSNKKIIKSHVANDVNRKKRQDAVKNYQDSLRSHAVSEHASVTSSPSIVIWPDAKDVTNLHDNSSLQMGSPQFSQSFPIIIQSGPLYESWRLFCATLSQRKSQGYSNPQTRSHPSLSRGHSSHSSTELSLISSSPFAVPWLLHQQKAACIPRISSPTELHQFELSLNFVNAFLLGKNDLTWSHQISLNPYHYDHDYQVGVWREAFCLGFDHLQEGRCEEAFKLLDICLSSTTTFLQRQHPNMLYVLLEIMYEAKQIHDQNLSIIIQNNLTQMTAAVLGPIHPLTLLMKHLRAADPRSSSSNDSNDSQQSQVKIELLIQAVVDIVQFIFGPNRFQSTGIQFGTLRRLLNDKQIDQARDIISKVEQCWTQGFPPDALPLKYLEIDKAKVSIAKLEQDQNEIETDFEFEPESQWDSDSDDINVINTTTASSSNSKSNNDNTHDMTKAKQTLEQSITSVIKGLENLALITHSNLPSSTATTHDNTKSYGIDNTTTLPPELESLSRELVLGSCHALSLHMYIHVDEIFGYHQQRDGNSNGKENEKEKEDENVCFSTRIARLLISSP